MTPKKSFDVYFSQPRAPGQSASHTSPCRAEMTSWKYSGVGLLHEVPEDSYRVRREAGSVSFDCKTLQRLGGANSEKLPPATENIQFRMV